jgi:hypothetical protein
MRSSTLRDFALQAGLTGFGYVKPLRIIVIVPCRSGESYTHVVSPSLVN